MVFPVRALRTIFSVLLWTVVWFWSEVDAVGSATRQ
jgi:hypothetical protein